MGLATSRVWPPAGSATCVGVKSTPSEQSVASPRGSGVSARRAAWATLPPLTGRSRWAGGEFSDSCAVSPGCGSRSSFREVVCLRFTPRRVPTHSDPHAFSLCGSACAGQNAPPSGSLARPRPGSGAPGAGVLPSSVLRSSSPPWNSDRPRGIVVTVHVGLVNRPRCLCGHARASRSTWGTDSSGGLGKTGNSSLARLSYCTPISGRKSQTPASTISFFRYRASWGFIGLFFPSLSFLAM